MELACKDHIGQLQLYKMPQKDVCVFDAGTTTPSSLSIGFPTCLTIASNEPVGLISRCNDSLSMHRTWSGGVTFTLSCGLPMAAAIAHKQHQNSKVNLCLNHCTSRPMLSRLHANLGASHLDRQAKTRQGQTDIRKAI
jgi:hypothetical protein